MNINVCVNDEDKGYIDFIQSTYGEDEYFSLSDAVNKSIVFEKRNKIQLNNFDDSMLLHWAKEKSVHAALKRTKIIDSDGYLIPFRAYLFVRGKGRGWHYTLTLSPNEIVAALSNMQNNADELVITIEATRLGYERVTGNKTDFKTDMTVKQRAKLFAKQNERRKMK